MRRAVVRGLRPRVSRLQGPVICILSICFAAIAARKDGATYGANAVDIVGMNTFRSETEANAQNFAIHRAFIDGGAVKAGFFFMKYVVRGQRIVSNIDLASGTWTMQARRI